VQPTSRRLANLTYVALILALSLTLILFIFIADLLGDRDQGDDDFDMEFHLSEDAASTSALLAEPPSLEEQESGGGSGVSTSESLSPRPSPSSGVRVVTLELMSKHSLVVFLAANLLTGAVNASMRTIHAPVPLSMAVICLYMFAVCLVAWNADRCYHQLNSSLLSRRPTN
jgi:hypothetical protein